MTIPQEDSLAELFARLDRIQQESQDRIQDRIAVRHGRLLAKINKVYGGIAERKDALPSQKRNELVGAIGKLANVADEDWQSEFRSLLSQSGRESRNAVRDYVESVGIGDGKAEAAAIDDIIDYWTRDSDDRLRNKWGKTYSERLALLAESSFSTTSGGDRELFKIGLSNELAQLEYRALRIVRQSSNSVVDEAATAQYKASGVEYVMLLTSEDERVCPYCVARNRNIYRIDEIALPLHIQCRCLLVPIDKAWFLDGRFDTQASRKDAQAAIDEFRQAEPNESLKPGPSQRERSLGIDVAPEPIWSPFSGFKRGERPRSYTKGELESRFSKKQMEAIAAENGISRQQAKAIARGRSLSETSTWAFVLSKFSRSNILEF